MVIVTNLGTWRRVARDVRGIVEMITSKMAGKVPHWQAAGSTAAATAMASAGSASVDLNLEHSELVFYSGDRMRGALVMQLATPLTIAGQS